MTNLAIALMLALQTALPGVSQDRLRVVSEDMVSVVNDEYAASRIKGTLPQENALPMLAAVAVGESGLRRDIESCKVTGDGGKSVGLGQVMRGPNWQGYSRKEICGNRKLQLRLALHVLDACWTRAPDASSTFKCYTSGNPNKASYAARHEHWTYKRVHKNVSVSMASQKIQTCCIQSLSSFYVRERNTCEL
jgi:hypothetical protein